MKITLDLNVNKKKFLIAAVVISFAYGFFVVLWSYGPTSTETIVVEHAEQTWAPWSPFGLPFHRVWTTDHDGRTVIFNVVNDPFRTHFASNELYGQLIRPNRKLRVEYRGWSMPAFGVYPNIYSVATVLE